MKFAIQALAAGLLLTLPNLALTNALAAQDEGAGQDESAGQAADAPEPDWVFETSDVPVDPGFVFGRLDNGMRYILRQNATPEGTALVRMRIDSGSLDETDEERGLSHYLEHMAFNGSTNIPEGEMVRLLEREGLAFGADTNASTGYEAITYMLNLPRNDEALLDTALMLMRETASELTIAQDAVDRERGVILAERRDRNGFQQRAYEDNIAFTAPGARFVDRLPIGTLEVLENATAAQLRALYERTYTPENTVLVIVGDFPVEVMEAAIIERFSDWEGGPAPTDPETGPFDITRAGLTDIYVDPALSESVTITRFGPWRDRPDTIENRRAASLRGIAYAIVNRRLARLARAEDAPFIGARFSSGNIYEDARATTLSIWGEDGEWRTGMLAATRELNEALTFGFTTSEVTEQVANIRTALQNRVESESTRANRALVGAALSLVANERIPVEARWNLALFEDLADDITPDALLAALRDDAAALESPLIRFQGRSEPEGGEAALRSAFAEGLALPITAPVETGPVQFAYTDFGEPGDVVSDTIDDRLGFRYVTFGNGVRLTLKRTTVREDRISVVMAVDGGNLLNTREEPLRVYLTGSVPNGGLGAHSADELQTVLAGRSVSFSMGNSGDAFRFSGATTPRDLDLQLRLMAAALTDPGYRPEAIERFRSGIDNFFETLNATPGRAYSTAAGEILSDGDPRFSLSSREDFYALDFTAFAAAAGDRLANGALEIALVGDLDEDEAIAAVAATLGALPPRETGFQPREDARQRTFTDARGQYLLRHEGEPDQALIRFVWPTNDDDDVTEVTQMRLLTGVVRSMLIDRLREDLGQAYAPRASSSMSHFYDGYGTFLISVSVEADQVEAARAAIIGLLEELRASPVEADTLDRARRPLQENYDNTLTSLGGWMSLANRAQSEPDRLVRFFEYPDILAAVTVEDIQALAQRYLAPDEAVEFVVLPQEAGAAETIATGDEPPADTVP